MRLDRVLWVPPRGEAGLAVTVPLCSGRSRSPAVGRSVRAAVSRETWFLPLTGGPWRGPGGIPHLGETQRGTGRGSSLMSPGLLLSD